MKFVNKSVAQLLKVYAIPTKLLKEFSHNKHVRQNNRVICKEKW